MGDEREDYLMSNSKKKAPRLVGRQFAAPLSQHEIDQVAGGDDTGNNFNNDGTCTAGPDGD